MKPVIDLLPIPYSGWDSTPREVGFLLQRGVPSLTPMQVWSYRRSTGEHREPLGVCIAGGVDIPVMHRTTVGTGPLTNR